MKFHELKHDFLNNYMELEYFENYVLILNLFVIDLHISNKKLIFVLKRHLWPNNEYSSDQIDVMWV